MRGGPVRSQELASAAAARRAPASEVAWKRNRAPARVLPRDRGDHAAGKAAAAVAGGLRGVVVGHGMDDDGLAAEVARTRPEDVARNAAARLTTTSRKFCPRIADPGMQSGDAPEVVT